VAPDLTTSAHGNVIVALASRHRVPAVYAFSYLVAAGGLPEPLDRLATLPLSCCCEVISGRDKQGHSQAPAGDTGRTDMASWARSPALWATALWLAAAAEGGAQPTPAGDEPKGATALGGDIFGFTTPSDVGSPGEKGIAFDLTSGLGRRGRVYSSSALSTELSKTVARNLSVSLSSFAAGHRIRSVPELDDRSQVRFDGVSGEISYRFLERSRTNPLAATISVEPRVARFEADTGNRVSAYSSEFELLIDTVLIPNRLHGAMNLKYYVNTQRGRSPTDEKGDESSAINSTTDEGDNAARNGADGGKGSGTTRAKWDESAFTTVSGALAYQVTERVLVGIEARYLTEFSGAFLNEFSGHAVFVGPNLYLRLSDWAALNFAWTPQIWGRAQGVPTSLNLDNLERHQFRLKFAASF